MLSRLSSFLRHTLVNEVHSRVSLSQEVETLHLYLDIEKMRFEERLRPHFNIEPAVRDALLPSLLLQPLVENAIKYAVTPKEEGADISVSAKLIEGNVEIEVSDTGPGTNSTSDSASGSTGVGLGNIQERLNQAYGNTHKFEIDSSSGSGFAVTITLPFETREQLERQAELNEIADDKAAGERIVGANPEAGTIEGQTNAPAMATLQHKEVSP